MKEEWRHIAGFEGKYQVSSLGRVKSLARVQIYPNPNGARPHQLKEKILKGRPCREKYLAVMLYKSPKDGKNYDVHRLVLEAFVGSGNGKICNHINFDRQDNRVTNLEWTTFKGNTFHNIKNGKHCITKLNFDIVARLRRDNSKRPLNIKKIAKKYGVWPTTIWSALNGKTWKYKEAQA